MPISKNPKNPPKSAKKTPAKKSGRKVGRPPIIDDRTLSELRNAFSYAATDEEACQQANISPATLYRYIEQNPEFWEQKERLKKMPNFTAKKIVIRKIQEGDEKSAQWWLDRKAKAEFALSDTTINTKVEVQISNPISEKFSSLIQENNAENDK